MTGVVTNQQNTIYAREAYGVASFEWAGKCAALDRITRELGGMNPALRQGANGGLEVSGFTDGAPGLASTTVTFKEQVIQGLGDRLMTCLWDLDRRTHCRNLPMFDAWEKILRVALGRATSIDVGGSTMSEDEEELVTSLPWSAVDTCAINRVALSVQIFPISGGT